MNPRRRRRQSGLAMGALGALVGLLRVILSAPSVAAGLGLRVPRARPRLSLPLSLSLLLSLTHPPSLPPSLVRSLKAPLKPFVSPQ